MNFKLTFVYFEHGTCLRPCFIYNGNAAAITSDNYNDVTSRETSLEIVLGEEKKKKTPHVVLSFVSVLLASIPSRYLWIEIGIVLKLFTRGTKTFSR